MQVQSQSSEAVGREKVSMGEGRQAMGRLPGKYPREQVVRILKELLEDDKEARKHDFAFEIHVNKDPM